MQEKIKLYVECHGDCATIVRENLDELDPRFKISEEDKTRGYVEFIQVKITGTFYEDEDLPKVCPVCKCSDIGHGIANIPGAKVIGPFGAISAADMIPGIRALIKAYNIFGDYNVHKEEWEKFMKEKADA
jgi:hypothetical protein